MRHKPSNICSGTSHSNSQPRRLALLKALVAGGPELGMKKCYCLVDIFCNYNLNTCIMAPPIHKAYGTAKAFDCVEHTKHWKIVKEMGIPDHLTCLLRNLYAGYKAVKQLEQTWKRLIQNWERSTSRLYTVTLLI